MEQNKAKKQKMKIAELKKNVIKDIKEVSEAKETEPNLKLADRPLCEYFKTYKLMHIDIKTLLFCLMIKSPP